MTHSPVTKKPVPQKLSASVEIEVPFHDVDAMQVAWHGHYLKYFELARCALLRSFDYDYPQMQASGYLWPIVECELKYIRPARYGQRLTATATLIEHENRLRIAYDIRCAAMRASRSSVWACAVAEMNSRPVKIRCPGIRRISARMRPPLSR